MSIVIMRAYLIHKLNDKQSNLQINTESYQLSYTS